MLHRDGHIGWIESIVVRLLVGGQRLISVLTTELDKPYQINIRTYRVSGSVGVAVYSLDGSDADSLLMRADMTCTQRR